MGITDILFMVVFLGGAGYLFYRSFFRKKGPCSCCAAGSCGERKVAGKQHDCGTH